MSESVKPWDILNPKVERASAEETNRRFNICGTCPEIIELTSTCRQCGCFMYIKTKLKDATCPLGKW